MIKKDYEVTFAKVIVLSILTFLLLFYGNRYEMNYIYVVLAETALFEIILSFGWDDGQETITGLIISTCAILISTLCYQSRMNINMLILTYLACLFFDAFILYSKQTKLGNKAFPILVLMGICATNFKDQALVKLGIAIVLTLIIIVYGTYFYRAVIKDKIEAKRKKNSN